MKALILVLLFLGITTIYTQEKKEDAALKMEELPEVVIKSAGRDFSIYLPDKNPDSKVRRLEQKFISYDLGKDFEGYDNYLVVMEMKKNSQSAA